MSFPGMSTTVEAIYEKGVLRLTTAFAFDHHLHQFGTVQVVP